MSRLVDRPRSVLLLCDERHRQAQAVRHHVDALSTASRHSVRRLSVFGDLPEALDLRAFDAIVIHYSIMADLNRLLSPAARRNIGAAPAAKLVFVQDEHRNVKSRVESLRQLGAAALFTCVPEGQVDKLYPDSVLPGVRLVPVLTGYVPSGLVARETPPYGDRPIDVGYRARELPAWLGTLARDKARIGERFIADAPSWGLRCDISTREEDRFYGEAWIGFLSRCKATLGVESGASVFDPDGSVERGVETHLWGHPDASFDALRARYFANLDGVIDNGQISPRIFEAACLRTLLILYPGRYSGALEPWRHYVPLEREHGNIAEVVDVLRRPDRAGEIIDRAYREIARNPAFSYDSLTALFDRAIDETTHGRAAASGYGDAHWAAIARPRAATLMRRAKREIYERIHGVAFRAAGKSLGPAALAKLRAKLRALRARARNGS